VVKDQQVACGNSLFFPKVLANLSGNVGMYAIDRIQVESHGQARNGHAELRLKLERNRFLPNLEVLAQAVTHPKTWAIVRDFRQRIQLLTVSRERQRIHSLYFGSISKLLNQ
jgi:hypothetical protein